LAVGGLDAGWLGELHPLVCREWGIGPATAFQLELAELVAASSYGREQFEDVTTYPSVREDLAIVVDEAVPAARVREAVLSGGGELLRRAEVFDLYRGEQIGAGRKSIAMRLEFRSPERTLTDEEVAERRAAITAALREIGGTLRE
jgi:phenylalanyl-tRNA synthetase beta chain